jgi:hypothetical protein
MDSSIKWIRLLIEFIYVSDGFLYLLNSSICLMICNYMISCIILFHLIYELVVYIRPDIGHYILSNIHVPHIRTVSMDVNVNDEHTVGCTIARAADAHLLSSNSDSDDTSDNDNGSCAESCYPIGLKSDCGGQGSVLVATEKKNDSSTLFETCNNIFLFLIS